MAGCWSCGAERGGAPLCPSCKKVQPIARGASYFEVLGLPRRMALEGAALEARYRELSREVHPDRFGQAPAIERRLAVEQTTHLNDAYRTLKDAQRRAEYLLELEGVKISAEAARTDDLELLTEMLELQERVESEHDRARLGALAEELGSRRRDLLARLGGYFDSGAGSRDAATRHLHELRYVRRLDDRVEQKLEEMS